MVAALDSKSNGSDTVRVRVPLLAFFNRILY